jgi:hypothetical protein
MKSALLTIAVSLPMLAAGVDPALLALAAPDARVLAGVQVSQAQSTPIGQTLMAQIQLDSATNKAMADAGFDLRRDLREILVTISAEGSGNVMLFGRGSFHPAKIAAAGASAGATSSIYRGVVLLEGKGSGASGPNASGAIAFLDDSTMLAGDTASIKAAIDRHTAGTAFSGPLAIRARQIAIGNDVWLVTLTPPAGSPPGAALDSPFGPLSNVLQAALQLSFGLKFTATYATLSAEVLTRSPQDAQSMVDVFKFFVQMTQKNRPPGSNPPSSPSLADAAQISATGSALHVMISVSQQQLQLFLLPAANPPKKLAAR